MKPILGDKFIEGYKYKEGATETIFAEEEIIHFKIPSPFNPILGYSPLSSIASMYNIRENMDIYENALFSNMVRPEFLLTTEQILNKPTRDVLKQEIKENYGGVKKVGKFMLLEGGFKVDNISFSPRDVAFLKGRQISKEEIIAAFGNTVAMYDKDVNRANIEGSMYQYMKDTITPRLKFIQDKLNEKLIPLYDEKLFVMFDNVIPADKEFNQKQRESNLKTGFTTINEERIKEGLDEVDWGVVPIMPMNMLPIDDESKTEQLANNITEAVRERLNKYE